MRAKFREPIVVDSHARLLQFSVGHTQQGDAETGVKNLGRNAVEVLIFQPFDGIPSARPRGLVAVSHMLAKLLAAAAGSEDGGDGEWMKAGADEHERRTRY